MSIFIPQIIAGLEKIILHFTTLSVKTHFKIILELFLSKRAKKLCEPVRAQLCFFAEILPFIPSGDVGVGAPSTLGKIFCRLFLLYIALVE